MRNRIILGLTAACLALAACGGQGDDKLAEQAEEAAENKADMLDAAADNSSGSQEDLLEAQADMTREGGEEKADAIDESDINADAMSNAQKDQVVNGM